MTDSAVSAAPAVARTSRPRHFPALDGLRCLAFLLIFAHHALPRGIPWLAVPVRNAWCGVDLFFTLSGFLVSYLLFEEEVQRERETGVARFSLWRFWVRRALRIWPLYFLTVALGLHVLPHLAAPWVLGPAAGTAEYGHLVSEHGLSLWTFWFNVTGIAHPVKESPLLVLWSVSVEEQFYVLWPLALTLVPRRLRLRVIVGVLVAAVLAKIPVALVAESHATIYANTFLRADAFMAGALLAHGLSSRGGSLPVPPRWLAPALLGGALVLATMPALETRGPASTIAGYVLLDAVAAGFVWLCLTPGSIPERVLRLSPLRWMGTISYGLYVYHAAVIGFLGVALGFATRPAHSAGIYVALVTLSLAVTVAVAAVSYYAFERPFLLLKHRFAGVRAAV